MRGRREGERSFRDETVGAEQGFKVIGYADVGVLCRNVHLFLNCYQLMCPLVLSASSARKPSQQQIEAKEKLTWGWQGLFLANPANKCSQGFDLQLGVTMPWAP